MRLCVRVASVFRPSCSQHADGRAVLAGAWGPHVSAASRKAPPRSGPWSRMSGNELRASLPLKASPVLRWSNDRTPSLQTVLSAYPHIMHDSEQPERRLCRSGLPFEPVLNKRRCRARAGWPPGTDRCRPRCATHFGHPRCRLAPPASEREPPRCGAPEHFLSLVRPSRSGSR